VGLHSAGRRGEALSVLRAGETRHPYDLDILGSLVSMNREAGNARDALFYARKIAEVYPGDPAVKRLLDELERTK
jgi:Flp pilus assembly protein TadD